MISPGLILAAVLILVATQIVRVVAPDRGAYVWTLMLAIVGFFIGEVVALNSHLAGPGIGVLHPLPDAAVIAVLEAIGVLVSPRPAERGGRI